MNIGIESATYIKESLFICCCQIAEIDHLDIGNIDNVSEDVVLLWQKIIHRGSQLAEKDVDMDYIQDDSNLTSYHNSCTSVLELIIDKIEILE